MPMRIGRKMEAGSVTGEDTFSGTNAVMNFALLREIVPQGVQPIVNAKNSFRIARKTRFLKKAGFPDLSGKNFYHI
jgi:hypothetical protein